jgi:hypothetical protein
MVVHTMTARDVLFSDTLTLLFIASLANLHNFALKAFLRYCLPLL